MRSPLRVCADPARTCCGLDDASTSHGKVGLCPPHCLLCTTCPACNVVLLNALLCVHGAHACMLSCGVLLMPACCSCRFWLTGGWRGHRERKAAPLSHAARRHLSLSFLVQLFLPCVPQDHDSDSFSTTGSADKTTATNHRRFRCVMTARSTAAARARKGAHHMMTPLYQMKAALQFDNKDVRRPAKARVASSAPSPSPTPAASATSAAAAAHARSAPSSELPCAYQE